MDMEVEMEIEMKGEEATKYILTFLFSVRIPEYTNMYEKGQVVLSYY